MLTVYTFQNIKEGIEGKPVDWYSDVFDLVFPGVGENQENSLWMQVNNLWKKELAKPAKEEKGDKDEAGEELIK